jgi:Tol biopolymer transport system component
MKKLFSNKITSLRIVANVLLASSIFYSCDNQDFADTDKPHIWTPTIEIIKGDNGATLLLEDPRPTQNYAGKPPSNPDYFNILISDNLTDFDVYKKVDASTNAVVIDNLENGKSYYFMVTAHKGNGDPVRSDTVTTIPSEAKAIEKYFSDLDFSMERLSTSYDKSYHSFVSNDYNGSYGDKLYFKDNASGVTSLLEANSQNANWSGTTPKLVYLTTQGVGSIIYPFELKLFNPEANVSTTLFETPYNNYYVMNPTFTPDGEKVAFLSSENNPEKNIYDLWTINPVTGEKIRITNFEDAGFYMEGSYSFSKSGEELYLDGRHDLSKYKTAIYKLNTSTKIFSPVIETIWNDRVPSLSPDNTKLAFISDRTGKDELWIFDLVNSEYQQITGGPPYQFDSRYTNLEWANNDQMLITVFEDTKSVAVKIGVN